MNEITIKFNHDPPFTHVMIVPKQLTYKQLINRLQLKCIWRSILLSSNCSNKGNENVGIISENSNDPIDPSLSTITIFKSPFCPFLFYQNVHENELNRMKTQHDCIAIWLNYISSELEPVLIYVFYRDKDEWKQSTVSAINFDRVEEAIENQMFGMTTIAYERWIELKENLL